MHATSTSSSGSVVALIRCSDYEAARVYEAVGRGLALLGGPARFVKPGERLLLKPNVLAGAAPERAIATHPSVMGAVARHFREAGAALTYGDSPGFGSPESAARRSGLAGAAEAADAIEADFSHGREVSFAEGRLIKQFTIAEGALDADGILSLPKLKTHALTRMTGAVKNQFGCIPGILKGEFHARLAEIDRFAMMLVDLTRLLRPRLYVMDAIVAMEGNGPRGGTPRALSALLFSEDPVALDAVACQMMALDPGLVPTIRAGVAAGLGAAEGIELAGDPLEAFVVHDFKADRRADFTAHAMNRYLARFLRDILVPRPEIEAARCTRCSTCIQVCPVTPKALAFAPARNEAPPEYDYARCLRCYCCQEMCPEDAIAVHTPLLGRLLHRG